jgi:hypothetical protein
MLNISVGGDAAGGYLVDVHDGDRHGVYRPADVANDHEAFASAIQQHDPELANALSKVLGGGEAEKNALAERDAAIAERDDTRRQLEDVNQKLTEATKPAKPPKTRQPDYPGDTEA